MRFLRHVLDETIGLFVDDWTFALPLVAIVGLFAVLGTQGKVQGSGGALLFFGAIAALTLFFVVQKARSLRKAALKAAEGGAPPR